MKINELIAAGLQTGFIDKLHNSHERYQPKLLINDCHRGKKVLSSLINELRNCDTFSFSVSFITNSGVAVLINTLRELEVKGIHGKILTSQYLNFTEPRALRRLMRLNNLELRIAERDNHHSKGFIFTRGDECVYIIGSSNLTQGALSVNREWNVKLLSTEEGLLAEDINAEFATAFAEATPVTEEWMKRYESQYQQERRSFSSRMVPLPEGYFRKVAEDLPKLVPNAMQESALISLNHLREQGETKGLLISATGTGKTFLAAFDAHQFKAKKLLFIVHRETIARAALRSFRRLFGRQTSMAVLSGNNKELAADFIFSTIQTLSKEHIYQQFSPEHFDYVIIDEVHRAGAQSYLRILKHFNPGFLLGMSATPERTDGYDIFQYFNYNIAHEIRLNDALDADLLSPFHYYGVTDIEVNGQLLNDLADFANLTSNERVDKIIYFADLYGCDHGRVKGLIFCSRKEEAKVLSEKLNERGKRTIALDGDSSQDLREESIQKLEQDIGKDLLDYIITVDIFNEGVDIPSINQIIMLRPTQSAIIFVQQLGRGLRKFNRKEYLTVIDFIGNYANNYMVPIALYGDNSYNKDNIRRLIKGESSYIPGASTVNFDKIARERIYDAIDKSRLSGKKQLIEDYSLLKYKIGKIPSMMDFLEHGARDPYSFVEYAKSYYHFLRIAESEQTPKLASNVERLLHFISQEVCRGKRIEDILILKELLANGYVEKETIENIVKNNFNYSLSDSVFQSTAKILSLEFMTAQDKKKYDIVPLLAEIDGTYITSDDLETAKKSEDFMRFAEDTMAYGENIFQNRFREENFKQGFMLYEKYTRKDVAKILNWEKDHSATMFGYRIKDNACPIFVTYHKKDDISEAIKYDDYFINPRQFNWMTRNRVTLQSKEVLQFKKYREIGLRILLFVKKSDSEGSDFYYMGDMQPIEYHQKNIANDKGEKLPIVNIVFNMDTPVEENLFRYFEE